MVDGRDQTKAEDLGENHNALTFKKDWLGIVVKVMSHFIEFD